MSKLLCKLFQNAGIATLSMLLATSALAGTTGTEFTGLYNMIKGWSEGYLGRTLAIAAFLVGAIVGFARSTAMPALIGVVFAVLFSIGPGIIDGIASGLI
jgi:conjugal transfer pilus assembly protein TraA